MLNFKYVLIFIITLFTAFGCGSSNTSQSGAVNPDINYKVSFDTNLGTGYMESISCNLNEKITLPVNSFVRACYDFTGWALSSNGSVIYDDGAEITVTENLVLYAVWAPSSNPVVYTVIFNSNGGTGNMEPQKYNVGETKSLLLNGFVKDGYKFVGWSTILNGSPVYTDGQSILCESDMLLYAVWELDNAGVTPVNKITVYYNANEGDGYMVPVTVDSGTYFQLNQNIFTRGGYAFKGWSREKNGVVEYADMEKVSFSQDTELFAVWEAVPFYTITFHSNNGKDETVSFDYPSNIMPIKLPDNTFENGSLKFSGWKTLDNSISYIDGCDAVYLTGDLDLYALWEDNPVTIKFDAFNDKGEFSVIYAVAGSVIKLPKADFIRNGYELLGTYTCYEGETYGGIFRFGDDYTVPSGVQEVVFSVGWRELPKPPLPVFGGNSDKYKNQYVLVKGVNMTKDDWIQSLTPGLYYGVWNPNAGWYDSSQWRYNLCWAGTSSNMLHWWHDRNKENIEKYYNYYASDEIVNNKPSSKYYGEGVSDIFITYRDHWKDAAYMIDIGLEWYIFGTHFNKNGGGYFKEVFLEEDVSSVIESYSGLNQYLLNTGVNKAFEKGMAVGLVEINGFGSHAITLWGAHYDENGLIDGVIVADSGTRSGNNAPTGYDTGLLYMNIEYDSAGKPYMTNSFGSRLPLTQVVLLGDGAEQWKKYFETYNPIR